ncbi:MAG: hypothetical protein ACM3XN_10315 [Chloroflexota bacterium]
MLDLPANWLTHFNSADIVPPANDGDIHTGDGSVVFQFTGGRTEGDIYQDVMATANCCYSLEFWAKGGGDSLTASISYLSSMGTVLRTDSLTVHGNSLDSNSWTSYHIVGTPAPAGTQTIRALVNVKGSGKTVRLDDMLLTVAGCGVDP